MIESPNCTSGLRKFNPLIHKQTYYFGIHAPGGVDRAWTQHNTTFEKYLTATAGKRFDPPIEFKMKVTNTPIYRYAVCIRNYIYMP
jgi:hypothetical protein